MIYPGLQLCVCFTCFVNFTTFFNMSFPVFQVQKKEAKKNQNKKNNKQKQKIKKQKKSKERASKHKKR